MKQKSSRQRGAATGVASRSGGSDAVTFPRSVRFVTELQTACTIAATGAKRGTSLSLPEAHEVWAEYSAEKCAQWLDFAPDDPVSDIWRAITMWQARHPNEKAQRRRP